MAPPTNRTTAQASRGKSGEAEENTSALSIIFKNLTRVCCNSESDDLHNIDEDEHEVPTAKLGNGPSPMALPKHGENSTEQSRYHWPAHESRASADMGNLGLAYPATSQATSQESTVTTPKSISLQEGKEEPRAGKSSVPPKLAAVNSKWSWSDEVLEGFMQTTLVEGSGLVLKKRNSEGKGMRLRERIISYDPSSMMLSWTSKGVRQKTTSVHAKDIVDVACDGFVLTLIIYEYANSPTSLGRRHSILTNEASRTVKRKVFETAKERDAQIFRAILLLVKRRAGSDTPNSTAEGLLSSPDSLTSVATSPRSIRSATSPRRASSVGEGGPDRVSPGRRRMFGRRSRDHGHGSQ